MAQLAGHQRDHLVLLHQPGMPVAEVHLAPAVAEGRAVHAQALHPGDHLAHLPAVSPGVHVHAAAHRAGDAAGEHKAPQGLLRRRHGQGRQHGPRLGAEDIALCGDLPHAAAHADHQPPDAAVAHHQIAAVADERHRHVQPFCFRQKDFQLLRGGGMGQQIRRAAQVQGGIGRHERLSFQAQGRIHLLQRGLQVPQGVGMRHASTS